MTVVIVVLGRSLLFPEFTFVRFRCPLNSARREDDAENALSLRPQSRPDCVRPVLAQKCFAREKQSPSGRHQKEATQTPSCAA